MSAKLFKNVVPFAIEGEISITFTIEFDVQDLESMRDVFHQACLDRDFAQQYPDAYRIAHNLKTQCNDYLHVIIMGWFGGKQVYWGRSGAWTDDINHAFRYPKSEVEKVKKMSNQSKHTWQTLGYYDIEVLSLHKARVYA